MNLKNPFIFFSLLISANLTAYILTIIISKFWNKIHDYKENLPRKEIINSIFILFINIIIAIPGFILWHKNMITFSNINVFISFIMLFIVIDLLMYSTHYFSHKLKLLKGIHSIHHEHKHNFNCISLYHMSAWEAILFGLLITIVIFILPVNIYALISFLIFNWLYGVITHLNSKKDIPFLFIFTTNSFHQTHHRLGNKNFGFYTFFWDVLFSTIKKKESIEY